MTILAIKIDVDTERGTCLGVPNLLHLLQELEIPATFLFSLGPDNTGRAIRRVFRKGFLQKVNRTSVISTYGIKTLLNGLLFPGPKIGNHHADIMREVEEAGFEVGIHAYDHQRWQDKIQYLPLLQTELEFIKAATEFKHIFARPSRTLGAPGWQTNSKTLEIYDKYKLLYASDCRGKYPFKPKINDKVFNTLQVPTTLPTLDELIGTDKFPNASENLIEYYIEQVNANADNPNVITVHAELEGMKYLDWFKQFLLRLKEQNITFQTTETIAKNCLKNSENIPVCNLIQGTVEGRSGLVAIQEIF